MQVLKFTSLAHLAHFPVHYQTLASSVYLLLLAFNFSLDVATDSES